LQAKDTCINHIMPEPNNINAGKKTVEWAEEVATILADLNHSLRNPFSTIQSYLNILEMEEYKYSPEELKEITNMLRDTVDRSFKTIEEKMAVLREKLK
jgi:signal transduction histidine kinase